MNIFHSLDEIPPDFGPCAITIGNFDGVHVGHQALMRNIVKLGGEHGWKAAAFQPCSPPSFTMLRISAWWPTCTPSKLPMVIAQGPKSGGISSRLWKMFMRRLPRSRVRHMPEKRSVAVTVRSSHAAD